MISTSTLMGFAFGLMISGFSHSPTAAQPVTEEQSGALRGSMTAGSEWIPVASAEGQQIVDPEVDKEFLSNVEAALGTHFLNSNKDRIADVTKGLRPTFDAVSKNEYGKLGHVAVRYVLHRFFIARHGWLMKGLDPDGRLFDSASPVQVLENKTSVQVRGLFEERLAAEGFGLQELAVFASLLESLISEEVSEKLQRLRSLFSLPSDLLFTGEQAIEVMEYYMVDFLIGDQFVGLFGGRQIGKMHLIKLRARMERIYSGWKDVQTLVRKVAKDVFGASEKNSFANIRRALVVIGERFGKFQNADCQLMKQRLLQLESGEKGCVPLSNFYKGRLRSNGTENWQFGESVEYLRINGLIDEYDPDNLNVMIANYVNGPASCIASSHYYSVCCIDECEALMEHIESRVSGPVAAPDEIAALVAALPSSTVPANRTLPPSQMHRLQKIAEKHDGYIPLHGRLFMQWMHMVYPRECAYPHVAGTTRPITPAHWVNTTKNKSHMIPDATVQEMRRFVDAPVRNSSSRHGQGQCGRWIDEEELYIGGQMTERRNLHELEADAQTWLAASTVALLCVLAATTLAVIQAAKSLKSKFFTSMSWVREHPLVYV